MAKVILLDGDGLPAEELRTTVEDIFARAEEQARVANMAKRSFFPIAVRQEIEEAGYLVSDTELAEAMKRLDAVRRGEKIDRVSIRVTPGVPRERPPGSTTKELDMQGKPTLGQRFFESERTYPNVVAREWYDRLVGLDEHKRQLLLELELLLYPDKLEAWNRKHHAGHLRACQIMSSRVPLVLLEGDVGCGKSVLAETIGDALAERAKDKVHLLKVNTQVRGTGMVGEMTDLIVQAFTQAEARADALRGAPVLLLIDEADALAAKRADQHMHHEDKAGLNTLLQRIDSLRLGKRRIAVIFITNRPDALDPAIRRRAAVRLTFGRPDDLVIGRLFRESLPELSLSDRNIQTLVALTKHDSEKRYGATFTASDVTDRLIPAALRDAYAEDRPLTADDLIRHAKVMEPTPLMAERGTDDD